MRIAVITIICTCFALSAKPKEKLPHSSMTDAELIDIIKKAPDNHNAVAALARRKQALKPVLTVVFDTYTDPKRSVLEAAGLMVALSHALPEVSEIRNRINTDLDSTDQLLLEKTLLFVRIIPKESSHFETKVRKLLNHSNPAIRIAAGLTAITINARSIPDATKVFIQIFDTETGSNRIRAARL